MEGMSGPGVATKYPFYSQQTSCDDTIFSHGRVKIDGTGRLISARKRGPKRKNSQGMSKGGDKYFID